MRPVDVPRARRIAERLRKAGDTPAADLIERLLEEAQKPRVTLVQRDEPELDWEL